MQIVTIFIQNDQKKILIQKRSQKKGGKYGITSGHTEAKETNIQGAKREINEELGIHIKECDFKLFYRTKINKTIYNLYYVKKEIDVSKLSLQKEEVEKVYWYTIEEIKNLIQMQNLNS